MSEYLRRLPGARVCRLILLHVCVSVSLVYFSRSMHVSPLTNRSSSLVFFSRLTLSHQAHNLKKNSVYVGIGVKQL